MMAASAFAADDKPAIVFDIGGKFDKSFNESMYNGFCSDLDRYANQMFTPLQDRSGVAEPFRFGSAHSAGCNFAFCDGRVATIAYDIDPPVHECYGNRGSDCSGFAAP